MIKCLLTPCKLVDQSEVITVLKGIDSIELKVPNDIDHLSILRDVAYDVIILCSEGTHDFNVDLIEYLNLHWIGARIIVVSDLKDEKKIRNLSTRGVNAFLSSETVKDKMPLALRAVMRGERYMDPDLVPGFQFRLNDSDNGVSKREREIIRCISQGLTTAQIAEKLFISPHTVKTHRKNINAKLDIHNTAQLIDYARKHHI